MTEMIERARASERSGSARSKPRLRQLSDAEGIEEVSKMVERVARRLASINSPLMWERLDGYLGSDVMSAAQQDVYRALSRATIEAMRERDEAMLDAGTAVLMPLAQRLMPGSTAVAVWEAMIDAALSEP